LQDTPLFFLSLLKNIPSLDGSSYSELQSVLTTTIIDGKQEAEDRASHESLALVRSGTETDLEGCKNISLGLFLVELFVGNGKFASLAFWLMFLVKL
jgi:hypothetical protein